MELFLASVLLVFVAATVAPGGAVICYECKHPGDSDCKHPTSKTNTINCSKSCGKLYVTIKGESEIKRGCSVEYNEDECNVIQIGDIKGNGCFCNSDRCNGASFQSVSVVAMATLVLCAATAAFWR